MEDKRGSQERITQKQIFMDNLDQAGSKMSLSKTRQLKFKKLSDNKVRVQKEMAKVEFYKSKVPKGCEVILKQ